MAPPLKTETAEPLTGTNGATAGNDRGSSKPRRLINPQMVLLKVSLFLIFGATSSLIPYLTIHMQSLGLTVQEIAAVYLTLLFTTCLSPPITGYIVDRFGRYKPVLLVCLVLNMVSHHALDSIPRRQQFELLTTKARVIVGSDHNVTVTLDLPCRQTTCPTLDIIEKQMGQLCIFDNTTTSNVAIHVLNSKNQYCGQLVIEQCSVKSLASLTSPIYNVQCAVYSEYDKTFWYYLVVRFVATTMLQASLTITDPITLAMIEQHGGDFGHEKLFSSAGMAIFTPLTGLLIDYYSKDSKHTDYEPAFYTYDILLLLALFSVALLPIGKKLPSESILRHLMKIVRHPHVVAFIIFLFFLGSFWGFIESYLFVIMKEMGSPNYLLGLTYTVGTVASIPMMYLTGPITKRIGHVNLLVIAFFAHALRILGYSFIYNPFWCFPIELNEAISCYFMWVVATTYCAILAPTSLVATLIGVSGMVHFCLGKGIGSFAGGYLIAQYGTRMAFRYTGYFAVACGICYKIVHMIWLKQYDSHRATEVEDHTLQDVLKRRQSLVPKCDEFGSLMFVSK